MDNLTIFFVVLIAIMVGSIILNIYKIQQKEAADIREREEKAYFIYKEQELKRLLEQRKSEEKFIEMARMYSNPYTPSQGIASSSPRPSSQPIHNIPTVRSSSSSSSDSTPYYRSHYASDSYSSSYDSSSSCDSSYDSSSSCDSGSSGGGGD